MECPYCGVDNPPGTRYCSGCGKHVSNVTGPTSTIPSGGFVSNLASNSMGSGSMSTHDSPGGGGRGQHASNAFRSLTPGARLQGGRYVINKVLGQGGMGAALLATDIRLDGKPVVIKELISDNNDPVRFQDDVRNFKREMSTLAHLSHPLIPNVTDHFQEGNRYFMVQDYVEGETLEAYLVRTGQPMRERDALVCASEMLDVLDYLSQLTPPMVHRDIKPGNIIIGAKDKRAHLVDFGIARADVAKNAQRKQTSALGTPGYAPPEQYQGNADPRSDLYALAATLHHVLTSRDPRNHPPFIYPSVRTFNPQLSPDTERVLTRALNNDINQRYQSAAVMKQAVDNILQKRFGLAGSVNNYVLGGSSGSMKPEDAVTMDGTLPSSATVPAYLQDERTLPSFPPSTYQSPPITPPSSGPGPLVQPPPPQRQRKRRSILSIVLAALLLLVLIAGCLAAFSYLRSKDTSSSGTPTAIDTSKGIGVTKIGNEVIGISDGTFPFDLSRSTGNLKQQAADALKKKDSSAAISYLNEAIRRDPSDAEAQIYLEDQRVLSSGSPYVTLVVGTMLLPDNIGILHDDLQGAYVAQKEFNDGSKLNGGFKVQLLIANSGSDTKYATDVAKQVQKLVATDKTVVGVMGWPFSSRAVTAVRVLGAAHIPMVSQTASGDQLTNISPYFFRVVPSNKIQGVTGAKYAEQNLHANNAVLFVDTSDPYSQSLAQDFRGQFEADGKKIIANEEYKVGKPDTLPALLQDALAKKPDVLYFSGYSADMSTLLTNLPANNKTPIVGGDALYELNGYNSSASAGFTHLHFTAFAYPDEWDILGLSAQKPNFFNEYGAAFDPSRQRTGSYGYGRADNDAILSYDATLALLNACNRILASGKSQVTAEDVRRGLAELQGANAFQGVSGQIAFGHDGDPVDKAIVILSIDPVGHVKQETVVGKFTK